LTDITKLGAVIHRIEVLVESARECASSCVQDFHCAKEERVREALANAVGLLRAQTLIAEVTLRRLRSALPPPLQDANHEPIEER
jgi:hypothetical protein